MAKSWALATKNAIKHKDNLVTAFYCCIKLYQAEGLLNSLIWRDFLILFVFLG